MGVPSRARPVTAPLQEHLVLIGVLSPWLSYSNENTPCPYLKSCHPLHPQQPLNALLLLFLQMEDESYSGTASIVILPCLQTSVCSSRGCRCSPHCIASTYSAYMKKTPNKYLFE